MNTEDRLTRIESLMQSVAEHQVRNQIEIENLINSQRERNQSQREQNQRIAAQDQRVSALTESTLQVSRSVARLSDLQERTEDRLLTLIEHVDGIEGRVKRLERGKNRPGRDNDRCVRYRPVMWNPHNVNQG
jgi:hypothetical protein